jgi:uncharacterized protein (DUF1810 family)
MRQAPATHPRPSRSELGRRPGFLSAQKGKTGSVATERQGSVEERRKDDPGASDPYDLERFVLAQNAGGTYDQVTEELRQGQKASHWMWFVFPQIEGLGRSETARKYAISSLEEAKAYLAHPVLGPRLIECAGIVAMLHDHTAQQIFGAVDAQKLHSSMTLFHEAAPDEPSFTQVLDGYFDGHRDEATTQRI